MRLGQLRVLSPCSEDFGKMDGEDAQRFCDKCEKHVHNLSALTRADAQRLLKRHAGQDLCVRYESDRAGLPRFRRAHAGFVAVLSFAMAACTGHLDGAELESPDAALCQDAAGYSVGCAELDYELAPQMYAELDGDPELGNDPEPGNDPEDTTPVPTLDDDTVADEAELLPTPEEVDIIMGVSIHVDEFAPLQYEGCRLPSRTRTQKRKERRAMRRRQERRR